MKRMSTLASLRREACYTFMLVTNRTSLSVQHYVSFVKQCALSGITAVQLREKEATLTFLREFGSMLKAVLDPLSIPLIVNDHVEIALQLDAAGVHLGQTDGNFTHARERLGPQKIIGVSVETYEECERANSLPLNYIAASSVFTTKHKSNVKTVWGLGGLEAVVERAIHPVVAIGGIALDNIDAVMATGVKGVAVIGALHDAEDPIRETLALRTKISNHIRQT